MRKHLRLNKDFTEPSFKSFQEYTDFICKMVEESEYSDESYTDFYSYQYEPYQPLTF